MWDEVTAVVEHCLTLNPSWHTGCPAVWRAEPWEPKLLGPTHPGHRTETFARGWKWPSGLLQP